MASANGAQQQDQDHRTEQVRVIGRMVEYDACSFPHGSLHAHLATAVGHCSNMQVASHQAGVILLKPWI